MYKLTKNQNGTLMNVVIRNDDNASIPFAPGNTDYQQFKKDIANGVELQDAEGNAMTTKQISEFLSTLT